MQSLILEKTVTFRDKVDELIQVSIDDNINYSSKDDGILLNGKIYLNGEVKVKGELDEFLDTLEVDIFAPYDEIVDKRAFTFRVDDFEYKTFDNKIIFYLKVIIDGWSDMKSTFPTKDADNEEESTEGSMETLKQIDINTDNKEVEGKEEDYNVDMNLVTSERAEVNEEIAEQKNEECVEEEPKTLDKLEIDENMKIELAKQVEKINLDPVAKEDLTNLIKNLNQDIIVIDEGEKVDQEESFKMTEAVKQFLDCKDKKEENPIKIIEETPSKIETKKVIDNTNNFSYFDLFRNNRKSNTVFWRYRVVLKDETYESIGNEIKVSEQKIRELNDNKPLELGMLIKIPL
jgi:hypothetical protein